MHWGADGQNGMGLDVGTEALFWRNFECLTVFAVSLQGK